MFRIAKGAIIAVITTVALTGCLTVSDPSSTANGAGGHYKVGKPYRIAGVWYYPKEEINYDETGLASWYGDKFHGKKTANGETYNQFALSAAHKTLPMPVMARVTNLENGKQIVVRINDRGPFVKGRIIDLSSHSAKVLGFSDAGTAKVRVQYIGKAIKETSVVAKAKTHKAERKVKAAAPINTVDSGELAPLVGAVTAAEPALIPSSTPDASLDAFNDFRQVPVTTQNNIYVQAGSFQMRDNATRLKGSLERKGYRKPGVEIRATTIDGVTFYRVQVGPIGEVDAADHMLERVLAAGYTGSRIIIN